MPRRKGRWCQRCHKVRTPKQGGERRAPGRFSVKTLRSWLQFPFHLSKQILEKWISWLPEKIFVSVKNNWDEMSEQRWFFFFFKEGNISIPRGRKTLKCPGRHWHYFCHLMLCILILFLMVMTENNQGFTLHIFSILQNH